MRIASLNLASLSAALMVLASGAATSFSGAIAGAKLRLSQPKPILESKTRQASAGGYTKTRTSRASAKRAAAKRRNVLRNRRAHR